MARRRTLASATSSSPASSSSSPTLSFVVTSTASTCSTTSSAAITLVSSFRHGCLGERRRCRREPGRKAGSSVEEQEDQPVSLGLPTLTPLTVRHGHRSAQEGMHVPAVPGASILRSLLSLRFLGADPGRPGLDSACARPTTSSLTNPASFPHRSSAAGPASSPSQGQGRRPRSTLTVCWHSSRGRRRRRPPCPSIVLRPTRKSPMVVHHRSARRGR